MEELFIGGHKLPEPLSEEEFRNLIKEANNGSKEAKDKIITHNIRLVLHEVTHKFQDVDYDKKDLVSIGSLGLVKAVDTYDLSTGFKFTTYASRCIDNEILKFLKKLKKDNNVDSLEKIVNRDKEGNELELKELLSDNRDFIEENEKDETCKIIRKIVEGLPDRDREIIMLYFGFYNDHIYTQSEISNRMNIDRSCVSRLISKNVQQIGKILESQGMIELQSNQYQERKVKKKNNVGR